MQADLIVINATHGNGSFEAGNVDPNNGGSYSGGSGYARLTKGLTSDLADWTVQPGGTDTSFSWYMSTAYTSPEAGDRLLNLCLINGSVSQGFSVTAGTLYTVSYYERYCASGAVQTATIALAAGGATGTTSQATLGTESAWTPKTFSFTPNANTTATLMFQLTTQASSSGTYLDNVSVTAVSSPEPSALVLLGSALLGLLAYAWRKRR